MAPANLAAEEKTEAGGFQYLLFDLDGTLTDPGEGITNSVSYALKKFGIEAANKEELYRFIGPPLWDSFAEYYGFSREQAGLAVAYYREHFQDRGIFENEVYPGVEELLGTVVAQGKQVILATSKPQVFAQRILAHFGLEQYFSFIVGSELDGTRVDKGEVVEFALTGAGVTDRSRAVMVGDRKHDIIGAKQAGIKSIGVLAGYGGRAELEAAGADYIVSQVADIVKLVL